MNSTQLIPVNYEVLPIVNCNLCEEVILFMSHVCSKNVFGKKGRKRI
jgi:hypothetical protein